MTVIPKLIRYGFHHSPWMLAAVAVILIVDMVAVGRLLRRTGHSPWWALLLVVPLANVIGLWVWAFTANGKRPIQGS